MSMLNKSCDEFLNELSSKKPVPGGGGAAALGGAIGMALSNMVGNLTVGKKAYMEVEPEVKELLEKGNLVLEKLKGLVDRDALVFEPLAKAYGLPRESEEEKQIRQETLEECSKNASLVPLEIMRASVEGIRIHARMAEIGTKIALSDIACGVAFLKAAMIAGSMNVMINLNAIQDQVFLNEVNIEMNDILKEGIELSDHTISFVTNQIRK